MKANAKSTCILLSVILSVCLLSAAPTTVSAEQAASGNVSAALATVRLGDVNGNGTLDIGDATNLQKHLAKLIKLADNAPVAADADWDGSIQITDATEIQKYLAEFSVDSPVGTPMPVKQPAVRWVNHRGYNTVAPENTLPAFRLSKEMGFPAIETDIQRTADGTYVCLHEDILNRTARHADGTPLETTVKIGDITYEQAQAYDFGIWKSQAYAGTPLPTLEEAVQLCRSVGLEMYIELKDDTIKTKEHVREMIAIVEQNHMLCHCTWISFNSDLLTFVKDLCPTARLGFLCDDVTDSVVNTTQKLQTDQNEVFINAAWCLVDKAGVIKALLARLPIEVWTVSMYADPKFDSIPNYVSGYTTNINRIV